MNLLSFSVETYWKHHFVHRLRGRMSARRTPNQKVAYSSCVGVSCFFFLRLTGLGYIGQ